MDGILVVDKPRGRSSASVVEDVRRVLGVLRAGHGGTLDPLATGVLAVCLGAATKVASYLLADDKAYEAELILGVETDTLDRTGAVIATSAVRVTAAQVEAVLRARMGTQLQIPPMYSAIKQSGVRLYKLARRGEEVVREPRTIRIDRLDLLELRLEEEPPRLRIAVACSKGTYIRSLVADIGTELGCGAHLAELRRTVSGSFSIDQAVTLEELARCTGVDMQERLVPLTSVTGLPTIVFPPAMLGRVLNGVQVELGVFGAENLERFQLVDELGELRAIVHAAEGRVIYDRVFKP